MPISPDLPTAMPSLTHAVWSWPWTRYYPRRVALYARHLGLTAKIEHDGGWLLRLHTITVTGDLQTVRRYHRTLRRLERGGPPPAPPRDLLDKLKAAATPKGNENAATGVRMSRDVTLSNEVTPHGDGRAG
jgi:hypothetical protein